jgi:hypothetical protein
MYPNMNEKKFSYFSSSDSLLAQNEHTHLFEVVYHEKQVIMASLGHGKTSNKVHGDALPRFSWYWYSHIQPKLLVSWLASTAKNTTLEISPPAFASLTSTHTFASFSLSSSCQNA